MAHQTPPPAARILVSLILTHLALVPAGKSMTKGPLQELLEQPIPLAVVGSFPKSAGVKGVKVPVISPVPAFVVQSLDTDTSTWPGKSRASKPELLGGSPQKNSTLLTVWQACMSNVKVSPIISAVFPPD